MFPLIQRIFRTKNCAKMARAQIKAGKLPMQSSSGMLRGDDPKRKYSGSCVVCGVTLPPALSWQIADFPGQPEMHWPRCFDAWHHAVRDELQSA